MTREVNLLEGEIDRELDRTSMPVDIVNGYPRKVCGCWDIKVKKECIFYWVEINHLLTENITYYLCKDCERILIKVNHHTEERY